MDLQGKNTPESLQDPPALVDQETAAERLGCEPLTLADWRYKGIGPRFVKVGRLVRYAPEELQSWIEQNTCPSTSDDVPKASKDRGIK